MASNPRRKSDAARRANQIIRSRTVLVMLLLGIVTFAVLFWKLYDIQIRQHSVLQEKAIEQQTRSAVVNASRGTVYDRNLNTLAISATAEDVNISPMRIAEFVESQKEKQEKAVTAPFEFIPSVTAVLNNVMKCYISGFIYSALIDSFCSEQNARMTAMDAANQNAQELLDSLSLQYNRVRQAAITQEITEVSAGAKAQRAQRRKEV